MSSATVRLLCESRSPSRTVRDAATLERPFYWRGSSVTFQLALADHGQFLLSPAVGQIIVEVKALSARSTDDSLMRKTFVAGDCDATFAAADWAGGAKQLLEARFTVAEAAILPGTYRLIVRHVDGDDEENTYLSTELQVMEGQSGSEDLDPPPPAWSYLDAIPVIRTDIAQDLDAGQQARAAANAGVVPLPLILVAVPTNGAITGMQVNAPGTDFDGSYTEAGALHGRPKYEQDVGDRYIGWEDGGTPDRWKLFNFGGFAPYKADGTDVPRPDLAGGWTDILDAAAAITITPIYSGGTPAVPGQFAIYGARVFKCISAAPIRWIEMVDAVDLAAATEGGGVAVIAGVQELVAWNGDQGKYQGIRIKGAVGVEAPFVWDLP